MTRAIHEYSRIITSRGVLRLCGRAEIESLIDRLMSHLDAIDGDYDLEDDEIELDDTDENENEPYCGFAREYWEAQA